MYIHTHTHTHTLTHTHTHTYSMFIPVAYTQVSPFGQAFGPRSQVVYNRAKNNNKNSLIIIEVSELKGKVYILYCYRKIIEH